MQPIDKKNEIVIITHSGSFHPDDVFGVATLFLLFQEKKISIRVVRTRNPDVIKTGDIVLDVGGISDEQTNRFDHHQPGGAGSRPDGIPYASFGLIWKKYGAEVSGSSEAATLLDHVLVQFIDAMDNGVGKLEPVAANVYPYTIGQAISSFNPSWKENPPEFDTAFKAAVEFALPVLRREIETIRTNIEGRRFVEEAYRETSDKQIIVLDKNYSWHGTLARFPEPLYVIQPSYDESGIRYGVEAVRDNEHSFVNRKDLPASWAGKRNEELAVITGVPDAMFCHTKLFFAVARSKEGAIALAKLALKA